MEVFGILRQPQELLVFCPRHGFGGTVYGMPTTTYDGPETAWHKTLRGEDCRCTVNGCNRLLVIGTMDAALDVGKRYRR